MKNGSIKKIGQGRNTGNDFVPFEITDIASIAVAKKYAGIGASLVARIKMNTPPETVPLDRTNGAPRPLKWCVVTASMVH